MRLSMQLTGKKHISSKQELCICRGTELREDPAHLICLIHIRLNSKECLHHLCVSTTAGPIERRLAILFIARAQASVVLEAKVGHVQSNSAASKRWLSMRRCMVMAWHGTQQVSNILL